MTGTMGSIIMVLLSGYVPRKEVLELESVIDLVVGDSEGKVDLVQVRERAISRLRAASLLDPGSVTEPVRASRLRLRQAIHCSPD